MGKTYDNLFEALAEYDYEALIKLYASNGFESLAIVSDSNDILTDSSRPVPFSYSSEQKLDESLYLGRSRKASLDEPKSKPPSPHIIRTLDELQLIIEKSSTEATTKDSDTSTSASVDMEEKQSTAANGNGNGNIADDSKIGSTLQPVSLRRSIIPFLPSLPMIETAVSPSPSSSSSQVYKSVRSMSFRRQRRPNRMLSFESKRNKYGDKELLDLDQTEIDRHLYSKAGVLSNSRPAASFTVHGRRNSEEAEKKSAFDNEKNEPGHGPITLFDGAVANGTPGGNTQIRGLGGGSGTILHLACALDSPFGLALLLAMGTDASSRHTAFRRLIIHEAACCDSPNCLQLLLEMGKTLASQNVTDDEGCIRSCQNERYSSCDDLGYPVKRQKSSNCLLDLAKSDTTTMQSGEMLSFVSFLQFALGLAEQIKTGEITEMDAARLLLSKAILSETNKRVISLICTVVEAEIKEPQPPQFPLFISYTHGRDATAFISNTDGHGNTALHWAAFKNSASCVSLLLEHGANPNAVAESTGWTPLHDAAYSDSGDAIAILVKAGANVNSTAHSGATPLCFAAQENSPNAAQLLLEADADASIRCCESGTSNGDETNNPQQFLLQQSRFSGYTPLHYCAHYNSHSAAVVLLEYNTKRNKCGSLFEIQDLNHKLPMHIVAERGSSNVMKELLHNGVRVDESDSNNTTRQVESQEVTPSNSAEEVNESLQTDEIVVPSSPSSRNATQPVTVTPISSPILQSLIPSEPIRSSKPWNCLSQNEIDECKRLLQEAELSWAPQRHYIFTPSDRVSIVELVKVGVRLNHIPQEIWLMILQFCGRGWFNPDLSSDVSSIICD